MSSDADRAALVEIALAIADIQAFTKDVPRDRYLAEREKQMAVAMGLVVIGEAANRLSAATRVMAPEMDWAAVVSLRNRIAHGYGSVDHRLVWSIVETEIDALAVLIARLAEHGA